MAESYALLRQREAHDARRAEAAAFPEAPCVARAAAARTPRSPLAGCRITRLSPEEMAARFGTLPTARELVVRDIVGTSRFVDVTEREPGRKVGSPIRANTRTGKGGGNPPMVPDRRSYAR
jgi:hypothetical protein